MPSTTVYLRTAFRGCPAHTFHQVDYRSLQRRNTHWKAGTFAQQPSNFTHLPALKCGDVCDIALVNAEGDNFEEVLESPAAIEFLHA